MDKDDLRAEMSRLTEGWVYCDLALTPGESAALLQLVKALRGGGQHQVLDRVLSQIEDEIEESTRRNDSDSPWSISSS